MSYFEPYIDSSGFHMPTYVDIRDDLINQMKSIFGNDIYIDEDTQDYQQISIFAKKIYDLYSLAILTYNNRTPNTAIGVGLDNLCALVGIKRKPATYSKVNLTLTGDPSTILNGCQASDGVNIWDIPDTEIPSNGIITVEATCDKAGNITAQPGSITTIVTPVYGWLSVTNNYNATPGMNEETDAELRGRFANSTSIPSNSVFESLLAGIQSVDGVTKVKGYENDTSSTDSNGVPAHSVSFVVEGGDEEEVATEILFRKTPGCGTYGTTSVTLTTSSGNTTIINFFRPTVKPVYVKVTLKPLSSYNSDYENTIKEALVNYINSLDIAETVYRSVLWSVAVSQMGGITSPAYSILSVQTSLDGVTYQDADVSVDFNEVAQCSISNITVVVNNA